MTFFYFIFGLFIGSFLNMLIDRLPRDEQVIKGRSHCDRCKHSLSWSDLVPVVSWLLLRGRCRYCKKPVPVRNTLVELLTGGIFAATHVYFTPCYEGINALFICAGGEVISLIILSCLIAIFFIDLAHQIIPDSLTAVASFSALLLIPFTEAAPVAFITHMLSAISAAGFFLLLVLITKGRGMGLGDVKFAGFMGLFLGYPDIVYSLYFAFLTGAIVSAMLVFTKHKKFGQTIAFGPFLVLGTVLAYFTILSNVWDYLYGRLV